MSEKGCGPIDLTSPTVEVEVVGIELVGLLEVGYQLVAMVFPGPGQKR
ncbi:hypothetical protein ATTO_12730 [Leptogranulimonas caecicola]|uniref:Uncharacterized protein n=1 Tax=Leptogranulimonas caecicola TaxID=2894156 RepID=A0AAU9CH24_9ACTN|nr:hypothetical protein ATTO_12730 [Leptogranulimonas caecicola]